MSYSIRSNAPRINVNGRTFAVDCVDPGIGSMLGLFEQVAGQWTAVWYSDAYFGDVEFTRVVTEAGGVFKWLERMAVSINAKLREIFGTAVIQPLPGNSTMEQVINALSQFEFRLGTDGVPVFVRK